MSISYSLELCYGVIVPDEIMEKIYQLTEEKFDDFRYNYANQINEWTGEDWFIGITTCVNSNGDSFVKEVSEDFLEFTKRVSIQKELEEFIRFYNYYNLKECFDWKPKLYLINFCY